MGLFAGRSVDSWISEYEGGHQHPVNRLCHTFGIPLIVFSLAVFVSSIFAHALLKWAIVFFLVGWTLQFIGHAFERKPPEFFHDWRFLFVGVRWWFAKMRGKA